MQMTAEQRNTRPEPGHDQSIPYGCEDFGRLESVLVHTPGPELRCINEANYRQWLFDRVPDVDRFAEEHNLWCDLLASHGVRVEQLSDHVTENADLLKELPNLMYLHDTAVVTRHGAILSRMIWPARRREEVVVKEALQDLGIPIWLEFTDPADGFEGCLLLDPDTILVAHTERHSTATIRSFIQRAGERFDEVIYVDIPKGRRYMHPDTIYNRVDRDLAIAYLPAFEQTFLYSGGRVREIDFAEYVASRGVEIIEVTDSEQQRHACTFVPLEPGVIFHYDTALDLHTARMLGRRGVEIILFHPDAMVAGGGSLRCITMRLRRSPGHGAVMSES
jgi:arginine deiminase